MVIKSALKFGFIALAALSLAACSSGTATSDTSASPSVSPSASATPISYDIAPLTGVKYVAGTNKDLALPSVACKVDNLDVARPQINLGQTDIVFDEMVEGGLTRFVAVWHSHKPTAVGPVRSIRPMDPDIVSPFDGIVCYSGGQLKFVKMMRATNVFNADETEEQGKGTFKRVSNREAPHNVVVNVKRLAQHNSKLAPPAELFKHSTSILDATAATTGSPVTSFKVSYPAARAEWVSVASRGVFVRNQDGRALLDQASGRQISAVNVVVLQVRIDRTYGYVPKTTMVSSGSAWVFTKGKMVRANWTKASQTAPIVLKANHQDVKLAPGNTWVELMPRGPEGSLKIVAPKPAPSASQTN